MNREEAIKVLNMVEAHGLADKAKKMAIKALEQEPCGDAISRQAVIDIIDANKNLDGNDAIVWIERELAALPSVSTEKLDKAISEIRYGENKAYNADFTAGCEYAIGVIERMLEEVEE